ncbi:MAG: hypothetical protein P1R58_12815, partial [bacterium]|nr:hypothetical protein [bacterium]
QFFDNNPGWSHEWDEQTTIGLAASEGFAWFFANVHNDDPIARIHRNNSELYYWVNSEDGGFGWSHIPTPEGSATNYGDRCEAAVAGIFWDIYDAIDDDFTCWQCWPQAYIPNPDDIGDQLTGGAANLITAANSRYVDGYRPDDINEFYQAWFEGVFLGNYFDLRPIWYEHNIDVRCCPNTTGNANGDPADVTDISDLTFIADVLWRGGPTPM